MNENRRKLIALLRAPMPEGFEWDFTTVSLERHCGTVGCAIGLAHYALGLKSTDDYAVAEFFYMSYEEVGSIFYDIGSPYKVSMEKITPAMVADALEALP